MSTSASQWITDNPDKLATFREAYNDHSLQNKDVAELCGISLGAERQTSLTGYISAIARLLECPRRRAFRARYGTSQRKSRETAAQRVARLKRELMQAETDATQEFAKQEQRIRAFVNEFGGYAAFVVKLKGMKW